MRLKLDENLPIELKRLMATSGHDAETVLDEGMGGKTDADVLTVCLAENRVLMTQDLDFSDIRAFPPSEYPGIIVFRLASQARDGLLEVCAALVKTLARSSPRGQLWIVEDSRIRIRG